MGLSCVPSLDHSYSHHPKRVGDGVRTGPQGSVLTVVLLPVAKLLLSLHTMHDTMSSCSTELLLLTFLVSGVFFSFLPTYSFQSGSGSLLFFFVSRQFEMHVTRHVDSEVGASALQGGLEVASE